MQHKVLKLLMFFKDIFYNTDIAVFIN